jgi:hypothetical protein
MSSKEIYVSTDVEAGGQTDPRPELDVRMHNQHDTAPKAAAAFIERTKSGGSRSILSSNLLTTAFIWSCIAQFYETLAEVFSPI